jgi:hypothetical protein
MDGVHVSTPENTLPQTAEFIPLGKEDDTRLLTHPGSRQAISAHDSPKTFFRVAHPVHKMEVVYAMQKALQ